MSHAATLAIKVSHPDLQAQADSLSKTLSVPLYNPKQANVKDGNVDFFLCVNEQGLSLQATEPSLGAPLLVDFCHGATDHRRRYGGGKGQDIAKAVGLKKAKTIDVLDATAGLGRDAFVLATLGCSVTLYERNPIVYQLLKDGLDRAEIGDSEVREIAQRMILKSGDVLTEEQAQHQVVYLDPMFPESKKSAKVKKEMQMLHRLVGQDPNADQLLPWALKHATHRVVVKRPRLAPFLNDQAPTLSFEGKSGRFDVYVLSAFA
jgi:16S rRNA (guanine1516-N2)-methyltransferase